MIEWFSTEVRYQGRDLKESVFLASERKAFSHLAFLRTCAKKLDNVPFPKGWEESIAEWKNSLEDEDIIRLKSLSGVLGACDVYGQLAALERIQTEFKDSLKTAATLSATKGKMFRSLGILGGLAALIISI